MKEGLEINQTQNLAQTLAPLQVQFVKLLEMNTAAIEDEVHRRLDENPALEEAEGPSETAGTEADPGHDGEYGFNETSDELQRADFGNEDDVMPVFHRRQSSDQEERMSMEANADYPDMADNLKAQLADLDLAPQERRLALYIIGNLDSNGRLTRTLAAIADDISIHTGLNITREDMVPAFEAVRSLDPAGVGAVDLRDCLLLQLKRLPQSEKVDLASEIIDRHFDLFASRHFDRLRARLGVTDAELTDALGVIRTLNPKPGNSEGSSVADRMLHITPDFVVEPDESDPGRERFIITLTQRIPELTVSESYRPGKYNDDAPADKRVAAARAFIRNRSQEATEFIDLLKRRSQTLLQVMRAIVDLQVDFFRTEDPAAIRPMILKDVAALTGRDMSVISRATNGKYVATPGGVYPLKMFFNERPTEDSDVSSHQILQALRALIDGEDKRHPLSDDALTESLSAKGFDIARRTVAKYREQLNIPNSRGRRSMSAGSAGK